jgi:hypothetical protein
VSSTRFDGKDSTVRLQQDVLGVAAEHELSDPGAPPKPDHDQGVVTLVRDSAHVVGCGATPTQLPALVSDAGGAQLQVDALQLGCVGCGVLCRLVAASTARVDDHQAGATHARLVLGSLERGPAFGASGEADYYIHWHPLSLEGGFQRVLSSQAPQH